MKQAYNHRPLDFKRRILMRIYTNKKDIFNEEYNILEMIKDEELGKRYYNLNNKRKFIPTEKIRPHTKHKVKRAYHPLSEEHRQHIAESNTGKKMSEECIQKRVQTLKDNGYLGGMLGKHHSEETKIKISQSNRGKNIGREAWNKGIPCSEEKKEKLRQANVGKNIRQLPDDFFEMVNKHTEVELKLHYGCGSSTLSRWKKEIKALQSRKL